VKIEDILEVPLPPWEACCSGVVSLYDVLQFYGDFFTDSMGQFNAFEAKLSLEKREITLDQNATLTLYAKLGVFAGLCTMHKLSSPALQCGRIMENLENKHMIISCGEMRDDLRELRRRCEDEFKAAYFLHLEPTQAEMYQKPDKDWESVGSRFYKVKYNIEESGKCFALERYGASVFHVLQVAEYGVIQIAELMEVGGDKPGWAQLKKLQTLIAEPYPKRSPLAQKHSQFLEDVLHLAVIVKDNWRHKLDHVDNQIVWVDTDFSPLVAGEIISATRAFMRKLASDLPQKRVIKI
jgi:hypothetical protein